MSTLTFYHQKRQDGGIRTGIEVNHNTVLTRFRAGRGGADPALLWYVDVRCEGKDLPVDGDGSQDWLLEHETEFAGALRDFAEKLTAGADPDTWPISYKVPGLPRGIHANIVCSAMRRVEAMQLTDVLQDLADSWRIRISELKHAPAGCNA